MKLAIAPYVMPFVYAVIAAILVVGLIKISVEVLAGAASVGFASSSEIKTGK